MSFVHYIALFNANLIMRPVYDIISIIAFGDVKKGDTSGQSGRHICVKTHTKMYTFRNYK